MDHANHQGINSQARLLLLNRSFLHMEFQGFPRIHSIFYALFDVHIGSVVRHQVPEGSIAAHEPGSEKAAASTNNNHTTTTASTKTSKSLIDFDTIREYIIPKPQLYKRLVTVSIDKYKVLGFPVAIRNHEKYEQIRNEFRFNLCFVFERDAETSSYEGVVSKLARVLEVLEVRRCILRFTTFESANLIPFA